MTSSFEPVVVAFCCTWCSYLGADTAGIMRLKIPANIRVLRVMCSGRVDLVHILWAFANGADGVCVNGCHPGDCHYVRGNVHARHRMDFIELLFEHLGLRDRVEMNYIAASEPQRFRDQMTAFVERIRRAGPGPLKPLLARGSLPDRNKRKLLLELLEALARKTGVDLDQEFVIEGDVVLDGFGMPSYDQDKCVGCGACYQSCPRGNIEMSDVDGTRRISCFHWLCDTCGTCETVCTTKAITVRKHVFDLSAMLSQARCDTVALALRPCQRCGQPVGTERHIAHAREQERQAGFALDEIVLCRSCRRAQHAATMRVAFSTNRRDHIGDPKG